MHSLASASPHTLATLLRGGARTTAAAHAAWRALLPPGATAVDATAGNGNDTLALARLAGPSGRVFGLDTSVSACAATRAAADAAIAAGETIAPIVVERACHSTLADVLAAHGVPATDLAACVFNLGWLPGAEDKDATATRPDTTLAAIDAAAALLRPGGFLSVASYIGHAGGRDEADQVRDRLAALPPAEWIVSEARLLNRPTAPLLTLAWRKDG